MAEHMYGFVKKNMRDLITSALFIAMTCAVDNTSCIAIHL